MGNGIKLLEKPSKTSVKNDMRRLRDLGKKLISLTDGTLKNINLPDHIYVCIQIAKKMSSDEAKRRQISFLGKQLRDMEDSDVLQIIKRISSAHGRPNCKPDEVYSWQKKLLLGDTNALEEFVTQYPNTDRQKLKNLKRAVFRTRNECNKLKAKKKLFEYITHICC